MNRRDLLKTSALSTLFLNTLGIESVFSQDKKTLPLKGLQYLPAKPFSFAILKKQAQNLSTRPYIKPSRPSPQILDKIDYDAHGKIQFQSEFALNNEKRTSRFPVTFFHMGRLFQKPVRMHIVEGTQAREIGYNVQYFSMPDESPAKQLTGNVGFAGFRVQEPMDGQKDWKKNDWLAFLGASYFRSIGDMYQYGLSARGVAINAADPNPPHEEEFPDFSHFWFEFPEDNKDNIIIYALLNGPSIAGAFKFTATRTEKVVIEIEQNLYLRTNVNRLGIAPLTSMYWYSETEKLRAVDWRPEVHDSDGLAMLTGDNEQLWRPLNNPDTTTVSTFTDKNPKGFGLMQRDQNMDHYLDGVHYERRPSLWIEPQGAWGEGTIQLIEIPTNDEIHDNIVAHWTPKEPAKAGAAYEYKFKMTWAKDQPNPSSLGKCVATRLGNGGQPGTIRPKGVRKFVVEFLGEALTQVALGEKVEAVISSSRGELSYIFAEAIPNDVPGHWRAQFDLKVTDKDPVELRCFLKAGDKVLTETWAYQYRPFD